MKNRRIPLDVLRLFAVLVLAGGSPRPVFAAPALDGEGAMVVSPNSVTYGSVGLSFTFTFTANVGDFGPGSQVALTVPAGWPAPVTAGAVGLISVATGGCTLTGSPGYAVTGATIFVDIASCLAGQSVTVTYSGVTPPGPAGSPYTFFTQTDIGTGGQGLVNITAGSPAVAVTPLQLTVSATGLTPADKSYDGTTTTSLTVGAPALVGVLGADVVALDTTGATGTFADRNVGTAKVVSISGLALAGADAANYTLAQPVRAASITTRPVTISAVTDSKLYDGTTSSTGVPVVSAATPLVGGDTPGVLMQSFDNRNAGPGKTLTPAGVINDGNGGQNYAYAYAVDATGLITPRPITVTAVTDTKVYDGTTSSVGVPVLSALTPLVAGDTEPAWMQSFDSNAAGSPKTLTPAGAVNDGNGGQNYVCTFVPDMTGSIGQRPVTIAANAATKALGTPDPPLTWQVTAGSLAVGDTLTLLREPGERVGQYPITLPLNQFPAEANYNWTFTGAFLTISPTVQFVSAGMWDGWVLESTQTSNVGGSVNAAAAAVRLGDDAANRQYRSILSFDTSLLPDTAVIRSAVLKLRHGPMTGQNPFGTLGALRVDIRKGTFGTKALTATDFQAAPSAAAVGVVGKTAVGGWHTARLSTLGMTKVNKAGLTQLRLYFQKGDNGNRKADFMSCSSGNAAAGARPQLIVTYDIP